MSVSAYMVFDIANVVRKLYFANVVHKLCFANVVHKLYFAQICSSYVREVTCSSSCTLSYVRDVNGSLGLLSRGKEV